MDKFIHARVICAWANCQPRSIQASAIIHWRRIIFCNTTNGFFYMAPVITSAWTNLKTCKYSALATPTAVGPIQILLSALQPWFAVRDGELVLAGIHWAISTETTSPTSNDFSIDTYIPAYLAQIEAMMSGETITVYNYSPIPEPTTLFLLALAAAMLIGKRRIKTWKSPSPTALTRTLEPPGLGR